jgi:hypothetical protein
MMNIPTGWRSLRKDWSSKVTIQSGIVDLGQFDFAFRDSGKELPSPALPRAS